MVISPRARLEDDRGPEDGTRQLSHVTLAFRRTPAQHADLDAMPRQLQDSSSPNYHKWLTPEEFGERFGRHHSPLFAPAAGRGFTIESTARGRGWLVVSGTVAEAQRTFHTEIHRYPGGR